MQPNCGEGNPCSPDCDCPSLTHTCYGVLKDVPPVKGCDTQNTSICRVGGLSRGGWLILEVSVFKLHTVPHSDFAACHCRRRRHCSLVFHHPASLGRPPCHLEAFYLPLLLQFTLSMEWDTPFLGLHRLEATQAASMDGPKVKVGIISGLTELSKARKTKLLVQTQRMSSQTNNKQQFPLPCLCAGVGCPLLWGLHCGAPAWDEHGRVRMVPA